MPEAPRARAFWSGTISFGLVSIPVNLFSANQPRRVSLRMLSPEGTPLARRYYDPQTDEEVSPDDIVRGYEIDKDEFVVVSESELEALAPEKTRDIDLRVFVDKDDIDPTYFERAYFLTPAGSSTKAYRLLAATMEQTDKAGIATFVMRTKEYLVAILAENGILRAETLRFHDEVRPVDEIDLPEPPRIPAQRTKALEKQIEKLTRASLDESELEDEYADRLLALVERKQKEGDDVVTAPAAIEDEEAGAEVIDLMEVLKRSLRGTESPARRSGSSGGRGSAARRKAAAAARSNGALEKMTKSELYERAQELDIPGRSGMNKDALIRAIRKSA